MTSAGGIAGTCPLCPHCGGELTTVVLKGLTQRQLDCIRAIDTYAKVKGCAPSYMELLAVLGLASRSNVHRLVHGLKSRGWLTTQAASARSVALTGAAKAALAEGRV